MKINYWTSNCNLIRMQQRFSATIPKCIFIFLFFNLDLLLFFFTAAVFSVRAAPNRVR